VSFWREFMSGMLNRREARTIHYSARAMTAEEIAAFDRAMGKMDDAFREMDAVFRPNNHVKEG
jgi:hypothetical protein